MTELFMMNREALIFEVETLAKNLLSYSEALKAGDRTVYDEPGGADL